LARGLRLLTVAPLASPRVMRFSEYKKVKLCCVDVVRCDFFLSFFAFYPELYPGLSEEGPKKLSNQ
jgi:hypothetical protein